MKSLVIINSAYEPLQICALENYYINTKRSLLGLLNYILLSLNKSVSLYTVESDFDTYQKLLVNSSSKLAKKFLF